MWPFQNTVAGLGLPELLDWVQESHAILADGGNPNGRPLIAMPPVQRSAVWRPKQVLEFCDSALRGLPLGVLYLVEQNGRRIVVDYQGNTSRVDTPGFDLLDGQQRVRALLVGFAGLPQEKRCLWVDLGTPEAAQRVCLRITSKAQPFGYTVDKGAKLSLDQRRAAREQLEQAGPLQCFDDAPNGRPAYDSDLFEGNVRQNGQPIAQPPKPWGTSEQTFKLHCLFRAWRKASSDDQSRLRALRVAVGHAAGAENALDVLHKAFRRVERSQLALLHISLNDLQDPQADLLTLFERIGAGGTALSSEERLFSIYKFHKPYLRDSVNAIHNNVGHVLPPTRIATTAIRIAYAQSHADRNDTPDFTAFARMMTAGGEQTFRNHLDALIPAEHGAAPQGQLFQSFAAIKNALSYHETAGEYWLPDVLLASLPAELWQVLTYWAVINGNAQTAGANRQELVRFAMFWHIFSTNNEKAARWAFAHIRENNGPAGAFPGGALYAQLIGAAGGERCALALVQPCEFAQRICQQRSAIWRTDAQRFGTQNNRNEIGSHWWWNRSKILPWLQRDYLRRVLPGFAPLTEHEDDIPYDMDHICPRNDWMAYHRALPDTPELEAMDLNREAMRLNREILGNGIGNFRLVESSQNRADQDADVCQKIPCICMADPLHDECLQTLADSAFPSDEEQRNLWQSVSNPVDIDQRFWNADRLAAFQQAVERRAAWLYKRFYTELGFQAWVPPPAPAP